MRWRQMLFFPPLVVGLALFYALRHIGAEAEAPPPTAPVAVRVATLEPLPFAPTALGYGRVEAERDWQAISQVEGRVVALPDGLAVGRIVSEGEIVTAIDPRDYEIAKAKAEANLASADAAIKELEVEASNTERLLAIERRIEEVRAADAERQRELQSRGAAAQAALDEAERALLSQIKIVQDLENQLTLIPVRRISLDATKRTRAVELEEAERDLANTSIAAPFRGRVAETSVAEGQYVRGGDVLMRLEDLAAAEITASFQPSDLRAMILAQDRATLERMLAVEGRAAEAGARLAALGFTAAVFARWGDERIEWPAEISRVTGQIDDATGALGVVVRVVRPSRPNPANRRPPLAADAFVEVRLTAPPREMMLAPREAVRSEQDAPPFVYLMDEAETLRRAEVELGPIYDDQVVLRGGVAPGATLVLSAVAPAILGMPLAPVLVDASGGFAAPERR